eukprot:190057-Chlamydomonas_euryale.AAC.6
MLADNCSGVWRFGPHAEVEDISTERILHLAIANATFDAHSLACHMPAVIAPLHPAHTILRCGLIPPAPRSMSQSPMMLHFVKFHVITLCSPIKTPEPHMSSSPILYICPLKAGAAPLAGFQGMLLAARLPTYLL